MVGEVAVPLVIAFDVGVEQEDGDNVAGDANDVEAPGANQHLTTLHGQGDDLVGAGERCLRRPGDVHFALLALRIEDLAEVAAAVRQRDSNHGAAGVRRGTKCVAGQHAQATGVGGKGGRKGNLHGKIGDAARGEIGTSSAERVGKAQVVFPFLIRTSAREAVAGCQVNAYYRRSR